MSAGNILEKRAYVRYEKKDKFKDETPLDSMSILSFWSVKMPAKIETGHCVQVSHAISV